MTLYSMASLVAAAKLEIRVLHVLKSGAEVVGQVREGRAVELVSHPLIIGAVRDALEATDLAHDCQSSLRQHFRGLKGKPMLAIYVISDILKTRKSILQLTAFF